MWRALEKMFGRDVFRFQNRSDSDWTASAPAVSYSYRTGTVAGMNFSGGLLAVYMYALQTMPSTATLAENVSGQNTPDTPTRYSNVSADTETTLRQTPSPAYWMTSPPTTASVALSSSFSSPSQRTGIRCLAVQHMPSTCMVTVYMYPEAAGSARESMKTSVNCSPSQIASPIVTLHMRFCTPPTVRTIASPGKQQLPETIAWFFIPLISQLFSNFMKL